MPAWKGYIPDQEANYFELLLGHVAAKGKEAGLERLCGWYRRGYRLREPHRFQQYFNALLYNEAANVRRWALNAIALAGTRKDNLLAVLDAIERDRGDPDILAAGVAALVKLTAPDELLGTLEKIHVPLEGATLLAAAQHTTAFASRLAASRVDPETAGGSELRLATVLVGLNKAPKNIFSIGHDNEAVIGELNLHHDKMVAQYSVWAVCEREDLGVGHLRLDLKDLESRPDNVRGWTFQLIASRPNAAADHREYLLLGSQDPSDKARLGLAAGLRRTYFDGLEELIVDWFAAETNAEVRLAILDHMAAHADRIPGYLDAVKAAYREAGTGSMIRARLEAGALGTEAHRELKKIAYAADGASLFGSLPLEVTHVTNISGKNVNIGIVGGSGKVVVQGDLNLNQTNIAQAKSSLAELRRLLESDGVSSAEGKELLEAAEAKPGKSTIGRLLDWMKKFKEGAEYAVGTSKAFSSIYGTLSDLAEALPD